MNDKILYFFSGFSSSDGFPPRIAESLRGHIVAREFLVFIATDPDNHSGTDEYAKGITRRFYEAGMEFAAVHVLDGRKSEAECAKLVGDASVVFLMGGRTLLQYQFIMKNNLACLLKRHGGVIMGISAGAINMAEFALLAPTTMGDGSTAIMYKGESLADIPAIIYRGVGLADISVTPHYSSNDKASMDNVLLPFSHKIDIYAMGDDSAIVINNGEKQYFGDICHISKGRFEWIKQ